MTPAPIKRPVMIVSRTQALYRAECASRGRHPWKTPGIQVSRHSIPAIDLAESDAAIQSLLPAALVLFLRVAPPRGPKDPWRDGVHR